MAVSESPVIAGPAANRRRWPLVAGAAGYLAVALWLLWNVLTLSVSSGATCTCSDVSQFTWFLSWPSVALAHLANPFYSTAMFHPGGINLLANTSVTGLGIPLTPLEWLIGPTATFNVALIVTPVASGVAMMWLARRFVANDLLCFVAGALYAFSPMVLFHQALGHLNVTFLALIPVVVALVDDLLFRRTPRPRRTGLVLGLVMSWQFFIGSEVFAMTVVAGTLCIGALAVAVAMTNRPGLARAWHHGAAGFAVATATAILVLAAPIAYATLGPGHYRGPVWPGQTLSNASIRSFFVAQSGPRLWFAPQTWSYLQATYLAPALIVTVAAGLVVFRRDRRLQVVAGLAALMAWLTLGSHYVFAPWHYAVRLPLLVNVVNERFSAYMFLFGSLALAISVELILTWRRRGVAIAIAVVAITLSVAPYVDDALHVAPYPASTLWIPNWYQATVPHLAQHEVILGFPFFNTSANLLGVQAHFHMSYSVVGGTTPQWLPFRQGAEAPGYRVIWNLASTAAAPHMTSVATSAQRAAVLSALRGWRATLVVVPFTNGPNTSVVARDPSFVEGFMASILGAPTSIHAGAWVWRIPAA